MKMERLHKTPLFGFMEMRFSELKGKHEGVFSACLNMTPTYFLTG